MSGRKSNVFFKWKTKILIGLYGFAFFYVHVHPNVYLIQDTGSYSIHSPSISGLCSTANNNMSYSENSTYRKCINI